MHPFGNASMGVRRLNPFPYSPMLTRFDQDGDGDFDLDDVKIMIKKKKNEICGAKTKKGTVCQRKPHEKYGNRCHLHANDSNTQ